MMTNKNCVICGEEFIRTGTNQKYCTSCADIVRREDSNKQAKEFYQENKEICLAQSRLWAKNNPEKNKQFNKNWRRKNNKLTTWTGIKNRCKNKHIKLQMSKEEFFQWYDNQIRQCIYCGILEEEWLQTKDSMLKLYKHLHIDRKDNKKGYNISNIVLACPRCNLTKSDFFNFKDMLKIGDIIHAYRQPL